MTSLFPDWDDGLPSKQTIASGAVHLPGWLSISDQQRIVSAFYDWRSGPVPIRAATLPSGQRMSVKTVCLGWHWQPYKYTRTATDVNGQQVVDLPDWLSNSGRSAVAQAYELDNASGYRPDTALVNFYDQDARMGMHQDKDEVVNEPVVSLSVGDSCKFRFGNTENRNQPYNDVILKSGDAFVFGHESRFAYHAVTKMYSSTAPSDCGIKSGRINITMRMTGLSD